MREKKELETRSPFARKPIVKKEMKPLAWERKKRSKRKERNG